MTKSLDQSWRRLFCAVRLTKTKPGEFLGHCSWASREPHWTKRQSIMLVIPQVCTWWRTGTEPEVIA